MHSSLRFAPLLVTIAASISVAACTQSAPPSPTTAAKPPQSAPAAASAPPAGSAAASSPPAGSAASPGASPAAQATSSAADSPQPAAAAATQKVNANTATVAEMQRAFEAAGISNPARWAREVDEYRPYPTNDPSFGKLRQELAKYNPSPEVLQKILESLTL